MLQLLGTDGRQGDVLDRTLTPTDRIRDNVDGYLTRLLKIKSPITQSQLLEVKEDQLIWCDEGKAPGVLTARQEDSMSMSAGLFTVPQGEALHPGVATSVIRAKLSNEQNATSTGSRL